MGNRETSHLNSAEEKLCTFSEKILDYKFRKVTLDRREDGSFGFYLNGGFQDFPVFISRVDKKLEEEEKVFVGDAIVEMNGQYVLEWSFKDVYKLFLSSGPRLSMVVTLRFPPAKPMYIPGREPVVRHVPEIFLPSYVQHYGPEFQVNVHQGWHRVVPTEVPSSTSSKAPKVVVANK